MSKIILINPPTWDLSHPPLNLPTLSVPLREHGYHVEQVDLNASVLRHLTIDLNDEIHWMKDQDAIAVLLEGRVPEGLTRQMKRELEQVEMAPGDMVCISMYRPQMINSALIAKWVRERCPNVLIVIGGIHPTIVGADLLKQFDCFDTQVIGSGEGPLLKLSNAWFSNKPLPTAEYGILVRTNGEINGAPIPCHEGNIGSLPYPDFDGLDFQDYQYPVIPIQTSRGCTGRCAFCGERNVWGKYRQKEAERVVEELAFQQEKYELSNFTFVDSQINADANRLEAICDSILRRGLDIRWGGFARTDKLSPELLEKMYAAGCRFLKFGMESGSQKILNLMRKGIKVERAAETLRNAHQAGIWTHAFWVIGFPGETEETLQETIQFIKDNAKYITSAAAGAFVLYPHADVGMNPKRYGVKNIQFNKSLRENFPDKFQGLLMDWLDYDVSEGISAAEAEVAEQRVHELFRGLGILTPAGGYQDKLFSYAYAN